MKNKNQLSSTNVICDHDQWREKKPNSDMKIINPFQVNKLALIVF